MRAIKIIFTFVFCLMSVYVSNAQNVELAHYYDGYWSSHWESYDYLVIVNGTYNKFCLHLYSVHPSEFFFKVSISNPSKYSDQEIRQRYKSKEWLVYKGVVEYYVTDKYPTIKDVLKGIQKHELAWGWIGGDYNTKEDDAKRFGGIAVKRTAEAEVRIKPYRKNEKGRVYNIFFDDVGIAIRIPD